MAGHNLLSFVSFFVGQRDVLSCNRSYNLHLNCVVQRSKTAGMCIIIGATALYFSVAV